MSLSLTEGVRQSGRLFALFLDVVRLAFRRPFQGREFVQQAWFIASVTILPTALVAIPFGAVIALQLGTLTRQLGAQSFTGAALIPATGFSPRYKNAGATSTRARVMRTAASCGSSCWRNF